MDRIAYFDNAATTFPKPECVYQALDEFARSCGVSLGRGQHKLSSRASYIADETRELLLSLFHCTNKKVVFTNTATEALNIILKGIKIPVNANVYITPFEHNAVTRTLHYLNKFTSFNIIELSANKSTYELQIEDIDRQFKDKKPFCVIASHVSNVFGAVCSIEKLFLTSKKYGAINIADLCQSSGLIDLNLSSTIFDYAVFAGHKTLYGPLGISGFITDFPNDLEPIIIGGTGIESANQDMPSEIPIRYEAGSHNTTAIAGLHASIEWILKAGVNAIYEQEMRNHKRLIDILGSYENITVYNPKLSVGVVSCSFDNYAPDEIGQVLSNMNIAFRSGLHCAPLAHKFNGTFPSGTVRFSVGYFNTDEDFDMLDDALSYIEENS